MGFIDRAEFDNLRSLGFAGIGGAYATIGTPLADRAVVLVFKNATNGDVVVSDDGVNDKLFLPANSFNVFDIRTNAPNNTNLIFPIGTQFYLKDGPTASTAGTFYIEVVIIRTQ